jgi:hypothetical protein
MKKFKLLNRSFGMVLLLSLFLGISSCGTALRITQSDVPTLVNNPVNSAKDGLIEFIGFKNSYTEQGASFFKAMPYFKSFGQLLESANIAVNRSDFYTGVYSFQEFVLYKSSQRYISYVDVISHQDLYNDRYANRVGMEITGIMLTCFGIFPIGLPLWLCANPNKSMLQVKGEYKLYIYDTEKQEIVYAHPFVIDETKTFKGKYLNSKTDHTLTNQRSRNIVSNAFLNAYNDAYRFLKNLNN